MQQLVANFFRFFALIVLMLIPSIALFMLMDIKANMDISDAVLAMCYAASILLLALILWGIYTVYRRTQPENTYFNILGDGTPWVKRSVWLMLPALLAILSLAWLHTEAVEWITGQTLDNGMETANQQAIMEMVKNLPAWVVWLYIVVFAPILEELMFRGIFFHYFNTQNRNSRLLALLSSSVVFAMLHLSSLSWEGLVYLGIGLVLGTLYLHTRDLRYPIMVHMANNAVGAAALYFS